MSIFRQHVRTCISKYKRFSGRASRSEFWHWVLFLFAVIAPLVGIFYLLVFIRGLAGPDIPENPLNWFQYIIRPIVWFLFLFLIFCLLPTLAVSVRRLRDAGYRPWIIVFPILLLIGSYQPILEIALSGMDDTPPQIPLPFAYAYVALTLAVCLLYLILLSRRTSHQAPH